MRLHKNIKPHCCHICGQCFVIRSFLISHLRTHSGEKPYTCRQVRLPEYYLIYQNDILYQCPDGPVDYIKSAPNETAYKRWSCHSGPKLLCKLCRTFPPPAMGARFTLFGHADHVDPLDGWRCCSQKRGMSRSIQVRQL